MNAAYSESYKFPASILALAVHGVFFSFLYFGFTWQSKQPVSMSVELWQSLPDPVIVVPPVEKAVVVPEFDASPPPAVVDKPDIVIQKKTEIKPVEKKSVEIKPKVSQPTVVESKKVEVKPPIKPVEPSAEELQAARVAAERAQQAIEKAQQIAALDKVLGEYTDKIRSKIRSNIVMPPDVLNTASVEFSVTLLPGGRVLSAHLTQTSGNAAYDNAVQRAINKSDPLPLPADTTLFPRFRELKLKFKPVE